MVKFPPLKIVVLLFFSVFFCLANAQDKPKKKKKFLSAAQDKITFEKAEQLFEEKNYKLALVEYNKLELKYPDEPILIFRLGVCNFYIPNAMEKSETYFLRLDAKKFSKTDLEYYLGRLNHYNYKFEEAKINFQSFLKLKDITKEMMEDAERYITYCDNGIELMKSKTDAQITNVKSPINSDDAEYVPVISSDENTMFFTYRGKKSTGGLQLAPGKPDEEGDYYEDIFQSSRDSSGSWQQPTPMASYINTVEHDACIALSGDGQKLFIFQNPPEDPGQIMMSVLDSNTWSVPKLIEGINSSAWEGSCSMSADERTIYFSSERVGGFGGKDIYSATLMPDGTWGNTLNLGINVNTEKDEDAPFIHPSGAFLIFSSNGHNSMGGYDIFRSDLMADTVWSDPINLGPPVNTSGDDIYYVLSADGKTGYYSSGKAGGYGQQDIYMVKPAIYGKKFTLVMVRGQVNLDDKPVKSEITVINPVTGKTLAVYYSNSSTGKYLINLPGGKEYKLVYKLQTYDPLTRMLNTLEVDSFIEANVDIQFYSKDYVTNLKSKSDSVKTNTTNTDAPPINTESLTITDLLKQFGDKKMDGLEFTVQIGAYNLPQNFNYSKILKLGKVNKQKLDDNITRFTMGKFFTLNESYNYKNKVVAAGVSDAFVTAIYKGKRYLLRDLVSSGILK
jgi:hypothetical protein